MPLFHGNALLACLLPGLAAGATVVLKERFSASDFLADVRRHGCTYFNYVGRALSYLLARPEEPSDADNPLVWCLGSEASPRDRAEFRRRFGCYVTEGYSSSEGGVVIQPFRGMPPEALGRPAARMDVAVLDPDTGDECPPARFGPGRELLNPTAAVGEIVGRAGIAGFEGYYANPEADAERTRDGWTWTGDLGYRDEDGTFYFAGRTADWLRVDGENFAAGPVEAVLGRFPGAAAVLVYGVPDPRTGDQVMAAIEPAADAAFDPGAFAAFLAAQPDLGTKWAPRFVRVVGSLPTTATGKVDRRPLRAERWETTDPVWWRPERSGGYRRLTAEDAAGLSRAFAEAGRAGMLS
jgi:fatty-acyl-CoA synthase